jgi:hypothetical protein
MTAFLYRVHVRDFRYWVPFAGQKKPPVETFDFQSLEDAQAYRAGLPADDGCIVTITPVPPPRARKAQVAPELLGGRMHAVGRKLTL